MILKYALSDDTADLDTITAEGDTETEMVTVRVVEDGVPHPVGLTIPEARELAAELIHIADRLTVPNVLAGITLPGVSPYTMNIR